MFDIFFSISISLDFCLKSFFFHKHVYANDDEQPRFSIVVLYFVFFILNKTLKINKHETIGLYNSVRVFIKSNKSVRGAHEEICKGIKTVRLQRLMILSSFIQTSPHFTSLQGILQIIFLTYTFL